MLIVLLVVAAGLVLAALYFGKSRQGEEPEEKPVWPLLLAVLGGVVLLAAGAATLAYMAHRSYREAMQQAQIMTPVFQAVWGQGGPGAMRPGNGPKPSEILNVLDDLDTDEDIQPLPQQLVALLQSLENAGDKPLSDECVTAIKQTDGQEGETFPQALLDVLDKKADAPASEPTDSAPAEVP